MSVRRKRKRNSVLLLGPSGSFSDAVASKLNMEKKYADTFADIFDEVLRAKAKVDFGFVPIQNSIQGEIGEVALLMKKFTSILNLDKKIEHEVDLCFACSRKTEIEKITKLYISPYVVTQCGKFLAKNFPHLSLQFFVSSSKSLAMAAKSKNAAAVGSEAGAKIFKLKILARHIQDQKHNVTTFLLFSKRAG